MCNQVPENCIPEIMIPCLVTETTNTRKKDPNQNKAQRDNYFSSMWFDINTNKRILILVKAKEKGGSNYNT